MAAAVVTLMIRMCFSVYTMLSESCPRQTGSGGKIRLLGISKRGDKYLRTLFIHGARAAALLTKEPGPWITELKKRRPASVAIVAMANKLARTVWAIAAHGRKYDKNHVSIRPY
ncbi:transposase [Escherichia coli]|nr:transposase [Escherichia coli]